MSGRRVPGLRGVPDEEQIAAQAEMLRNRLRKRQRALRKRYEREGIGAYRVYDCDIPEVRLVVDWYEGHAVVGELTRQQTDSAPGWSEAMLGAVAAGLGIEERLVHHKRRRTRTSSGPRYEKLADEGRFIEVREGPLRFLCNLTDYLDTGLFPDHRVTRARVGDEASGARVLNLYCYTGAFTCWAARGGAASTVSVDLSARYLDWARANLELNGQWGAQHELVCDSVPEYLRATERAGRRFELCILDPPSFSTRGDSGADFDVLRDHPALVAAVLRVLEPGGVLYFSTNHQAFEPRFDGLPAVDLREISAETVPPEYRRRIHRAWRMRRA